MISKSKPIDELLVAETLLRELCLDVSTLKSTEEGLDPPDCMLNLAGNILGIEIVGLIDQEARRSAEEVQAEFAKLVPRPAKLPFIPYAEWNKPSLLAKLQELCREKEKKISNGISTGKAAIYCDRFWLLIHTSESNLYRANVSEFLEGFSLDSDCFESVYFLLSAEARSPGDNRSRYPIFKLK
jgi:hypothetical protein